MTPGTPIALVAELWGLAEAAAPRVTKPVPPAPSMLPPQGCTRHQVWGCEAINGAHRRRALTVANLPRTCVPASAHTKARRCSSHTSLNVGAKLVIDSRARKQRLFDCGQRMGVNPPA